MYIGHPKDYVFPGSAKKDILVAAVGQAELVRGDWIKEGAVTWRFNHLEDHPRWVGPQFLGQRGTPDPNGRSPWPINGGDPNDPYDSWDDPPSIRPSPFGLGTTDLLHRSESVDGGVYHSQVRWRIFS